jgi:hypothetical protein
MNPAFINPIPSLRMAQLTAGITLTSTQLTAVLRATTLFNRRLREPIVSAMIAALPSATPSDGDVETAIDNQLQSFGVFGISFLNS